MRPFHSGSERGLSVICEWPFFGSEASEYGLWFVFMLKSKLDFHAFMYRIMIFHGSRCTRDHVFTSIFSVFHVSRFRKKAIHVSRLDPFQTHSPVPCIYTETCKKYSVTVIFYYIFHIKPKFFKTLFQSQFLFDFDDIFTNRSENVRSFLWLF